LESFRQEAVANYMEPVFTADSAATVEALRQVLASLPPGEIFLQDTSELRQLAANAAADRPLRWSTEGPPAESSQATISHCEALVAMTGSILVSSGGCGGRGASVVAPCHIVIARREQLLPDLESVMARAREIAFDNSFVGLISGSSRTADIEKLLIIGAHGPRRLVVIVQD
jgi:L-lactate dehydrogenase complex protein LldG